MKKTLKIILIVIGCLLLATLLFSLIKNLLFKINTKSFVYNIESEYENIYIETDVDDINIYLSDNNEDKINYEINKKMSYDIKVQNGTLYIKKVDNRNFIDKIFSFGSFKLDLYLSKEILNNLKIDCSTGSIDINSGFIFNNVDITNSTGDIEISSSVKNEIYIEFSTGDVDLDNCLLLGDVIVSGSTGDVDLKSCNCKSLTINLSTGDIDLDRVIALEDININSSTGDVSFDAIDAKNIYIKLSTGDVEGTILTNKFFITSTDTGRVKVPSTREGGECKVITSTGDITIDYK